MLRERAANLFIRLAYRLDPNRPVIQRKASGGWIINIDGVSLAHIEPGMVRTERDNLKI